MPMNDSGLSNPRLYFLKDGTSVDFIDVKIIESPSIKPLDMDIPLNFGDTITFESSCAVNRLQFLHLIGCVMPNNWLKQHGYPMRRRR